MKTPQEIAEMISKRFYPLPDADLDSLASIIESSKAAKGKLLLDNGQISKYLYYVESGLLRQFYYKNKRDITEHFSCEGNIVICIASTFQREPTRLLIEALEPTVYHRISFSEFSDLLKTSLAINRLYQKILEWALMLSQEKADSWRFESARKRYLRLQQEYPEAAKRASVNHIASYLLMTPESLSRVRAGVL